MVMGRLQLMWVKVNIQAISVRRNKLYIMVITNSNLNSKF